MAEPEATLEQAVERAQQGNWLFLRLPPWIVDTFSNEQKEALHQAVADPTWDRHLVNIRLSLPLWRRRYYMTVVGGEERRTAERRAHERHRYPVRTAANVFFVVGVAALFYALALIGLALQSAIVEF